MKKRWYVLRSKPGREAALCRYVRSRGHEVYLPTLPADAAAPQNSHSNPYFPGHMFVCADLSLVGSLAFQWMPFSRGLVLVGGCPAWIADDVLRAIQDKVAAICDPQGLAFEQAATDLDLDQHPDLMGGYSLLLDNGISGHERVCVLLAMLTDRHGRFEAVTSTLERLAKSIPTPER